MKAFNRFLFFVVTLCMCVNHGCSDDKPTEPKLWLTPDFILMDLDGNEFKLSNHQGHVVVLLFFKTT